MGFGVQGLDRISSPAWSEARGSLGAFPHYYSCTLLRGRSLSLGHQSWALAPSRSLFSPHSPTLSRPCGPCFGRTWATWASGQGALGQQGARHKAGAGLPGPGGGRGGPSAARGVTWAAPRPAPGARAPRGADLAKGPATPVPAREAPVQGRSLLAPSLAGRKAAAGKG